MPRGPFSSRVPDSLEPGPWARRLEQLRAQGRRLLDLSDHNPTTAGLAGVDSLDALRAPAGLVYAPSAAGLAAARAAIALYYLERGIEVDPASIILTASTSEAYAQAFRLLCDPGEAFLVPAPSYPLFEALAQAEGCRVETYPLRISDGAWHLEIAGMPSTHAVRAVVAVNPNHPTGSFLTHGEASALRATCAGASAALIADEVFADYDMSWGRPPGELAHTLLQSPEDSAGGPLTLVLSGLSKVCGLPQLKLGWIIVQGPPDLAREALERLEWLADTFLSVGGPVQHALPMLLAGRARFQDSVRARVARNRAALAAAIATMPEAQVLPADGGWSAVIALPPGRSDEEWALALLEHDVVVHPGYFYDFDEPGRIVVSLLPAPAVFAVALTRLTAIVAR